MAAFRNLYNELCSYENLELAFKKARRHKTLKPYVMDFDKNRKENLLKLRADLLLHYYKPKALETFIIRDPKTRKISKSDFRDRVVHHALCNIIEPIFEKSFISDSFANRIGKGTLKAVERFDYFKRKVSKNNTRKCFVLKADIRHYFEEVSHDVLTHIISRKVKDENVIRLIKIILKNYKTKRAARGMPLGNLTSQFFANVYLHELDCFIKHNLKAKHYVRYVDDFVMLHTGKNTLEEWKTEIDSFLAQSLKLELHPDKSKISKLNRGICFLGFRIFYHHRLLKKSNLRNMQRKLISRKENFDNGKTDYDEVYSSIQGWLAYADNGNTYNLRSRFIHEFEGMFPNQLTTMEFNRMMKFAEAF